MILNLLLGLGLGGSIGLLAYRRGPAGRRFASAGGAVAILSVCAITFLAGGWLWGVLPLAFFLSTNFWSRYRSRQKRGLADRFDSGATRTTDQVLARAGWGTFLTILHAYAPQSTALYAAFVGAWAAGAADAWATEIGVLSAFMPARPLTRLLISRRNVSPGTPGGISSLGLIAALVGSWLFGLIGLLTLAIRVWLDQLSLAPGVAMLPFAAMLGGMAGSLTDSLLGASAQGMYYCEHCERVSDTPQHACGEPAQQIRGWAWLTNDSVNFVGSVVGAAVAAVFVTTLGLR